MNNTIKKKESLLHTHSFSGYGGGIPYLYNKTNDGVVDGIKRMHIDLYCKCDTCDKEILIARLHCDENGKLYRGKLDEDLTKQI
jgi:hypothetical protein